MLASLSGIAPETAQKALTVSFALLVELGAAFGLFLATGHSFDEFRAPLSGRKPEKGGERRQKLEAVTIKAVVLVVLPSAKLVAMYRGVSPTHILISGSLTLLLGLYLTASGFRAPLEKSKH